MRKVYAGEQVSARLFLQNETGPDESGPVDAQQQNGRY
jgi:hypothetical protein